MRKAIETIQEGSDDSKPSAGKKIRFTTQPKKIVDAAARATKRLENPYQKDSNATTSCDNNEHNKNNNNNNKKETTTKHDKETNKTI